MSFAEETLETPSGALRSLGLLTATGTLVALSTMWAGVAADVHLSPLAFLTWPLVAATAILGVIGHLRRRLPSWNARTLEYFVVAGLISMALPNLMLFAAVPRVGIGFAVLALAFPPLWTYVGALLLRMERFQALRAMGVLSALTGATYLAVRKLEEPSASAGWVATTLAAPVVLALGNLYRTARWPKGARPEELAPGMLAAAALQLIVFGLVLQVLRSDESGDPFLWTLWIDAPTPTTWLLLAAQSLAVAVTYVLFFLLQEHAGPVTLSLLGSVSAVVGVPMAVVFLDESIPSGLLVGGTLIALGVALVTRQRRTL